MATLPERLERSRAAVFCRSFLASSAVLMVLYSNYQVFAQTQVQTPGMPPDDFWRWAIQQGGAFVVILIILFFYRRDWKTAVEFWKDQHAVTTGLVEKVTAANVEMTNALRENTLVTHSLKRAMEYTFPPRRAGEAAFRSDDPTKG